MYVSSDIIYCFFFFNDTATTEIYTLSLHDALPISRNGAALPGDRARRCCVRLPQRPPESRGRRRDRKSTRLNSSHSQISYAVFCLKKKKKNINTRYPHDACLVQPTSCSSLRYGAGP